MAEILAKKRAVTMTVLRRHQRTFGGPGDLYLREYLELAKLVAPATVRAHYWRFEDLALFAAAQFLAPPHPVERDLAESIRERARAMLGEQLRAGASLDGRLVEFYRLLGVYVAGCELLRADQDARRAANAKPPAVAS